MVAFAAAPDWAAGSHSRAQPQANTGTGAQPPANTGTGDQPPANTGTGSELVGGDFLHCLMTQCNPMMYVDNMMLV